MPTKKQRRRQQKNRRHEWEYVYVDEEGNEVDVDPAELDASQNHRREARERRTQSARTTQQPRRGRVIEPPSWRRVGRRALLIGPVVIVAMMLLNRNLSVAQRIVPAIVMLAFFLPFSYFTDSLAYKMYRKRIDRPDGGGARGAKS